MMGDGAIRDYWRGLSACDGIGWDGIGSTRQALLGKGRAAIRRDIPLSETPCAVGKVGDRERWCVIQLCWRVARVSQQKMLDGRVVRANEGGCSGRKGRSAPEREATNTPALQAGVVRCDVLMATLLGSQTMVVFDLW